MMVRGNDDSSCEVSYMFLSHCHTLYGCVNWNSITILFIHQLGVTSYMGVCIETLYSLEIYPVLTRHTLDGCVNWNNLAFIRLSKYVVTPFVGVCVETDLESCHFFVFPVTPYIGRVNWNSCTF